MQVDGHCHCGAIRFGAEVKPEQVFICHCTDCQTISGAPYRVSVVAPTRTFHLTGSPAEYIKRGDSGEEVVNVFCGTCGTALYSHKGERQPYVFLRIGAIRQRRELVPTKQGFCKSALPWAMDITSVPVA
jgi:hypothetical protein